MKKNILHVFPAFKSKNFQFYFLGQGFSLIGTWLQIVAEGWLVLTLTNSPFIVGLIAALATLPTFFFTLFSGVIVDRFDRRKIIFFTQSSSMVLALIFGFLTIFEIINLWEIGILAFLLGTVNALDLPARQAFAADLVEREDLHSAVSINAGTYNAARVIGPSIAGFLIAFVGVGGAFILNGLSYIAVLLALMKIRVKTKKTTVRLHPITAVRQGLVYSFSHPKIRSLLIFTAFVSVFGWSYTTLLPLIAKNYLHGGAREVGYLFAAVGLGAVCSVVFVSLLSKKVDHILFVIGGNTVFALSLMCFTFAATFPIALFFLFWAGFGLLCVFPTMNSMIQHMVSETYRGRVLSIYFVLFIGLFPLGNFQIGLLSEHLGPQAAIRIGSCIVLVAGIILYLTKSRVEKQHKEFIESTSFNEGQINP
jgi:MFS family permease